MFFAILYKKICQNYYSQLIMINVLLLNLNKPKAEPGLHIGNMENIIYNRIDSPSSILFITNILLIWPVKLLTNSYDEIHKIS